MQMTSFLPPTHRYASGALFALALHQAQIHQTRPLGFSDDGARAEERTSSCSGSSTDSVSEDPELWVHESSGLLRPVFRFLEIDSAAWSGLEETAGSGTAKHHIGAFLRLLSEDNEDTSEMINQELALSKSVDGIADNLEKNFIISQSKEKYREYEYEWREKCLSAEAKSNSDEADRQTESSDGNVVVVKQPDDRAWTETIEQPIEEEKMLSYQRKVVILYELLSACLADISVNKKQSRQRKGYDARHRVALRLLSTWIDIKWIKMEAIETMVACSAMALAKSVAEMGEGSPTKESNWDKWKRGGIIGAAALTGGTLMAITGGLAAPAIAAGFSALAPTLGTIIPVIGASGFAAAASAAGTVAGSVAVAASFGAAGAGLTGSKMARRIGSVDEFEFKSIGENHNQGRLAVEITVSGFAFDEKDFIRPWEGLNDNMERYALQWESKNIIAVSTAIQDWLTSRLAMELMKRGAMMTVLSSLLVALAWPATLLAATDFIDSKWTIAVDRL
ncbi:uncharacterized protein LOC120082464 isoform X2 [Benincasa hispida]|uniref:uncharacterized protein LOC120082464 isoform X2 n=1 Tax=Benincasa hispida TaxID=102211 RepID=UPI001902845E|nr:uncharacterized protein LOC120082464 isoform X2 [Benincasa hispida]